MLSLTIKAFVVRSENQQYTNTLPTMSEHLHESAFSAEDMEYVQDEILSILFKRKPTYKMIVVRDYDDLFNKSKQTKDHRHHSLPVY